MGLARDSTELSLPVRGCWAGRRAGAEAFRGIANGHIRAPVASGPARRCCTRSSPEAGCQVRHFKQIARGF